jgi:hypothetical protein
MACRKIKLRTINYSIDLYTLLLISLIPSLANAHFSFGIEFNLDDNTPQLNVGVDYKVAHHFPQLGYKNAAIGFRYNATKGSLSDLGHIRLQINADHSNPAIGVVSEAICRTTNKILDYNPALIAQLTKTLKETKHRTNKINTLRKINKRDEMIQDEQYKKEQLDGHRKAMACLKGSNDN